MKTIYKYKLKPVDEQTVYMPHDARILCAQMRGGALCLWALVNPDNTEVEREICIIGTGHPALYAGEYIDTVQEGPYVWHLFEKVRN